MLSCVQNVSLTEDHNISKETDAAWTLFGRRQMAAGQVHDIHYWVDYNERQGNNSQWCLCIGGL